VQGGGEKVRGKDGQDKAKIMRVKEKWQTIAGISITHIVSAEA